MRKQSSENKNGDRSATGIGDVYPDISAIFDIDDNSLKDRSAKKAEVPRKGERILTSPEGIRHLPKEEQKKLKAAERKEKRAKSLKKAKTRAIIILAVLLAALLAALIIWLKIADDKKPVIAITVAVTETLEKSYSDDALILTEGGVTAILIDNDYDVHGVAKNRNVSIVTDVGDTLTGTVTEIRETRPSEERFAWLTSSLLGSIPEVPVYAVSVFVNDPDGILKEGDKVTARVITDTAENAVTIPVSSVFMDGPQPYLWIYHSFTKKLTRQDVSVGLSNEEKTEVLRGLKKGEKVLSGSSVPSAELYDGIRVKLNSSP